MIKDAWYVGLRAITSAAMIARRRGSLTVLVLGRLIPAQAQFSLQSINDFPVHLAYHWAVLCPFVYLSI